MCLYMLNMNGNLYYRKRFFLYNNLFLLVFFWVPIFPTLAQDPEPKTLIVQLDDSGVANWNLTNPRKAFPLVKIEKGKLVKDENGNPKPRKINLVFENRSSGRIFLVKIPVDLKISAFGYPNIPGFFASEWDFLWPIFTAFFSRNIGQVNICEALSPVFFSPQLPGGRLNPDKPCELPNEVLKKGSISGTIQLTIYPGQSQSFLITADLWNKIYRNLTSDFKKHVLVMHVDFFNELEKPARNKAYFQIGASPELKSASNWKITATVGEARSPLEVPEENRGDGPVYEGDTNRTRPATGNLFLNTNIGSRAAAVVAFKLYKGDLGDGEDPDVALGDYRFDYFGNNHLNFRYGKYTLAAPSSSIAVKEKGETFEYRVKAVSVGYLLKRESETGEADDDDRDHGVVLLQLNNWDIRNKPMGLRTLSLTGLYGREEKEVRSDDPEEAMYPYDYWTVGGEVYFFKPFWDEESLELPSADKAHHSLNGSLAYYRSERDILEDDQRDAKGESYLLKLNWARLHLKNKSKGIVKDRYHLVNLTLGHGSGGGDERVDKSYLGETAAFAPDRLFLSKIAGVLVDRHNPDAEHPLDTEVIGKGLSNKDYAGLTYTRNFSKWITKAVKAINFEKSLTAASIQFGAHYYRLGSRGNLPDDNLGWEFNLGFTAQAKPAKLSFNSAYFDPGPALAGLVQGHPWSWDLVFSLTLDDL